MEIYNNGNFLSLDQDNNTFKVLVAHRGKIIYTGNEIPETYKGHITTDLGGKTIVPAFGDTHLHFISDSFFKNGLNLRGVKSYEDLTSRINQFAKINNPKIIIGFGLSPHLLEEKKLPNRSDLDKISKIPIFLVKYDGHAGIGNSSFTDKLPQKAKEAKGMELERGHFYLDSFYAAADFASKQVSPLTLIKNIINNSNHLVRKGFSFLHAAEGVGFPLDFDITLLNILNWFIPQDISIFFQTTDIKKVKRRKLKRIGGCFATALDGCFGSLDAALKKPYTNDKSNTGNLYFNQEKLNAFVLNAHMEGLQVSVHAIGDKAVEQAVLAFEYACKKHPRIDHRHIIIHAFLVNDDLLDRIAKLGIHLALQTAFLDWPEEPREYLFEILGDRAREILPLKSMLDRNITIANGSDAPCTEPDPIIGLHLACNHPKEDESISIVDALKMYTIWAAKLGFEDQIRGTLEVGKYSDFLIFDKNPLEIPTNEIKNLKITDVYLKGKKIN